MEKVGTPFFTTKENSIGLGLSIARRIVEAHNGTMSIESSKEGTETKMLFPMR
ncbi:ATP-binding protein [Ammoniphilus sp. CFH 90114]|uniref:ATP-binding protein n=1 Tax=Ammoniphilus sp. CFH 90114 TaxID=2493665 RepID=UPI0034CF53A7